MLSGSGLSICRLIVMPFWVRFAVRVSSFQLTVAPRVSAIRRRGIITLSSIMNGAASLVIVWPRWLVNWVWPTTRRSAWVGVGGCAAKVSVVGGVSSSASSAAVAAAWAGGFARFIVTVVVFEFSASSINISGVSSTAPAGVFITTVTPACANCRAAARGIVAVVGFWTLDRSMFIVLPAALFTISFIVLVGISNVVSPLGLV